MNIFGKKIISNWKNLAVNTKWMETGMLLIVGEIVHCSDRHESFSWAVNLIRFGWIRVSLDKFVWDV